MTASTLITTGRNTAWGTIGTHVADAMTVADALTAGNMADWQVSKTPLTTTVLTENGVSTLEVPGKYATVRTNTPAALGGEPRILGVVGEAYRVSQIEECAAFAQSVLDVSGACVETVGYLNHGSRFFLALRLPTQVLVAGRDVVDNFLLVSSSHDGSAAMAATITPVRFACTNQLRGVLRGATDTYKVRHTANADKNIEQARQALSLSITYLDEFAAIADSMAAQEVSDRQFAEITATLFPVATAKDTEASALQQRRNAEALSTMRHLFTEADTQDGFRNTAWGAYNAVTEYLDWSYPVKGGALARAERNMTAGWLEDKKALAFSRFASV